MQPLLMNCRARAARAAVAASPPRKGTANSPQARLSRSNLPQRKRAQAKMQPRQRKQHRVVAALAAKQRKNNHIV